MLEQEVFPNRQLPAGTPANIPVLDLSYIRASAVRTIMNELTWMESCSNRRELGGHNSADNHHGFRNEQYRDDPVWVWIHSITQVTLWRAATNVNSQNSTGGDLYIDLGNLSEDVLRDGRKSFENGLPKNLTDLAQESDETAWGVVPTTQSVVNAFALVESNSNKYQDVGLDGLSSQQPDLEGRTESSFFSSYLNAIQGVVTNPSALTGINNDPSNDNYRFFRGNDYDMPVRIYCSAISGSCTKEPVTMRILQRFPNATDHVTFY